MKQLVTWVLSLSMLHAKAKTTPAQLAAWRTWMETKLLSSSHLVGSSLTLADLAAVYLSSAQRISLVSPAAQTWQAAVQAHPKVCNHLSNVHPFKLKPCFYPRSCCPFQHFRWRIRDTVQVDSIFTHTQKALSKTPSFGVVLSFKHDTNKGTVPNLPRTRHCL